MVPTHFALYRKQRVIGHPAQVQRAINDDDPGITILSDLPIRQNVTRKVQRWEGISPKNNLTGGDWQYGALRFQRALSSKEFKVVCAYYFGNNRFYG
jgi:hypothetical protein